MTPERARKLQHRFTWSLAGVCVVMAALAIAELAGVSSVRQFQKPLAGLGTVLLSQVTYWIGWRRGRSDD